MEQPEKNKRGRPKGQPKTGGRQKGSGQTEPWSVRLPSDVVAHIRSQPNQAAYIERLVRADQAT